MSIWSVLGISPTRDIKLIKQAYAARLKQVNPEDDPTGFQALRAAYEAASAAVKGRAPAKRLSPFAEPTASAWDMHPSNAQSPAERRDHAWAPPSEQSLTPESQDSPDQVRPHLAPESHSLQEKSVSPQELAVHFLRSASRDPMHADIELAAIMAQPELQRLAARSAFEHAALVEFAQRFDELHDYIPAFAKYFDWANRASSIRRHQSDALLASIVARWQATEWVRKIVNARYGITDRHLALRMLSRPFDLKAATKFARKSSNQKAMRALVHELQAQHPNVVRYCIPPESWDWWTKRLAKHSLTGGGAAQLFLVGTFFSIAPISLTYRYIDVDAPEIIAALLVATITSVFMLDGAIRWWRRERERGLDSAIVRSVYEWRVRPQRRYLILAIAALASVLSADAQTMMWPRMTLCIALGAMWLLYGLPTLLVVALVLAWPVHGALYLFVEPLPELPEIDKYLDSIVVRQLLSTLIYPYFAAGSCAVYTAFTRSQNIDHGKVGLAFSLMLITIVGAGAFAVQSNMLAPATYYGISSVFIAIIALTAMAWRTVERWISNTMASLDVWLKRSRHGKFRWLMIAATLTVLALSADADHDNVARAFAVVSLVLAMYWFGAAFTLWVFLILSWPLHVAAFITFLPVVERLPEKYTADPMFTLQHLVLTYVYAALQWSASALTLRRSGKLPVDPMKQSFFLSLAILSGALLFLLWYSSK